MNSKNILFKGILTSYFIFSLMLSIQAQQSAQQQPENDLQNRVRELESQIETMRTQLEALKKSLEVTPAKDTKPTQAENIVAVKSSTNAAEKQESKPKQETRTLGIDLGSARITPYGSIYFNIFGNSGGTNNADVPLFAAGTNVANTSASVRQSRLGLKIDGPIIWKAKSSGVVEVDFFGGFPAVGLGENFGVVRMRLAYGRLDWDKTSIEAGQDWVLFAPNNPVSVAAAAIPQLAAAGNLWARIPQFRVEHRISNGKLLLQGAVLAPSTGDYPNGGVAFFLQPGAGAASRTPAFESRISFNDKSWFGTKKAGSIGLSGHYSRAKVPGIVPTNNRVDSYGVALDWNSPLHKRVSFSGEGFFGRNLAAFQGGIFQGYTILNVPVGGLFSTPIAKSIRTKGGWTQVGWNLPTFQDKVTVYSSIGIDDPRDKDLIATGTVLLSDPRKRNLAYTFGLNYKYSTQFTWGLEYRQIGTMYLIGRKQTADHLNLGIVYSF